MTKLTAEQIGQEVLASVLPNEEIVAIRQPNAGENYAFVYIILRKKAKPEDSIRGAECCDNCRRVTQQANHLRLCGLDDISRDSHITCDEWKARE